MSEALDAASHETQTGGEAVRPPNLLVVTNERLLGHGAPGVHDAFHVLEESGQIENVTIDSWQIQSNESESDRDSRLKARFASPDYDLAVVLSPRAHSTKRGSAEAVLAGLRGRSLAIWEGDAIESRTVNMDMAHWFRCADTVFSQWGRPVVDRILRLGATHVHLLPATYCHVQFQSLENQPPPQVFRSDVAMVASNTHTLRNAGRVPGSRQRHALARNLHRSTHAFTLAGNAWPHRWSVGPVPFREQGAVIRSARVSANWDHGPTVADASSNRLPISMVAGRIHLTTKHPGMAWLPGEDFGLFQFSTVPKLLYGLDQILALPDSQIYKLGLAAHEWSRRRLSHRESVAYQLRALGANVLRVPSDPWDNLPGPWSVKDLRSRGSIK